MEREKYGGEIPNEMKQTEEQNGTTQSNNNIPDSRINVNNTVEGGKMIRFFHSENINNNNFSL